MGSQTKLSFSFFRLYHWVGSTVPAFSLPHGDVFPLKVSTVHLCSLASPVGREGEMELREMGEEISQRTLLSNHVFWVKSLLVCF